jgi:hypothetical protein
MRFNAGQLRLLSRLSRINPIPVPFTAVRSLAPVWLGRDIAARERLTGLIDLTPVQIRELETAAAHYLTRPRCR